LASASHHGRADDVVEQCIEDGLSALLHRRYDDAFEAFARAAQLDASDRTVQANLMRLKQLEYENEGNP
jgi:hypothetical protein